MRVFRRFLHPLLGTKFGLFQPSATRVLLAAVVAAPTLAAAVAEAQVAGIEPGQSVVTRFSGITTILDGSGQPIDGIDIDGSVADLVDLRAPGAPPTGQPLHTIPQTALTTAGETGQVFGIAFDDRNRPNVYLTATSAFGLHRTGSDWMAGQWGPGGGPGTVYELDSSDGYSASVFAHILLGGRENTGASLGNIAFDSTNRQFFVSDLETGMIHRIGINGHDLGYFDHGVTGRAAFFDAATGQPSGLPPVSFDPASTAAIDSCSEGEFSSTAACWNFADFRRRVWGLAVHTHNDGSARLYYSVWGRQAFGNPDWPVNQLDQQNSVWSIGLGVDGGFVANDARREFVIPGFFTDVESFSRAGGSHPISDIAISVAGEMVLAERGGIRNLWLAQPEPFAWPRESRLMRYRQNEVGAWIPTGRHDVGIDDRQDEGQPYLRANGAGGVDFGFGYDLTLRADAARRDDFVWFTGDELCGQGGTCPNGEGVDPDGSSGVQGQAADHLDEFAPAAAYAVYPALGPATPPLGPEQSYFIRLQPRAEATFVGDIEIFAGGPPVGGEPDLAVTKSMPLFCAAGGICTARVTVRNVGSGRWSGPLYLRDIAEPGGLTIAAVGSPWICASLGPASACYHPPVDLEIGRSRTLVVDIAVPATFGVGSLNNCASIVWPLANLADSRAVVRSVQTALLILGYDAWPVDGIFGPKTQAAIAALQGDVGMAATGVIDAVLLDILFPGNAVLAGDGNPANDRACDVATIGGVFPPGGVHLPVGSGPGHVPPASIHQPIGSGPAHLFPQSIHLPVGSGPAHLFPASVHLPFGSAPGHVFPNSVHLSARLRRRSPVPELHSSSLWLRRRSPIPELHPSAVRLVWRAFVPQLHSPSSWIGRRPPVSAVHPSAVRFKPGASFSAIDPFAVRLQPGASVPAVDPSAVRIEPRPPVPPLHTFPAGLQSGSSIPTIDPFPARFESGAPVPGIDPPADRLRRRAHLPDVDPSAVWIQSRTPVPGIHSLALRFRRRPPVPGFDPPADRIGRRSIPAIDPFPDRIESRPSAA